MLNTYYSNITFEIYHMMKTFNGDNAIKDIGQKISRVTTGNPVMTSHG